MKGFILLTFSTVDAQDSHLHISRYCQPIYFPLPYAFYMGFLSTEKTLLRTYKRGWHIGIMKLTFLKKFS